MKQRHTWILLACFVAVMAWVLRKPVVGTPADAKTGATIHGSGRHETSAGETARKSPNRRADSEAARKEGADKLREEIGKSRH